MALAILKNVSPLPSCPCRVGVVPLPPQNDAGSSSRELGTPSRCRRRAVATRRSSSCFVRGPSSQVSWDGLSHDALT